MLPLRSIVPGIAWPALTDPRASTLLALLWQLDQTQWWPAEALRAHQQRQLANLVRHAVASTAHYAERFAAAGVAVTADGVAPARWAEVPVLTRAEVIDAGARLVSRQYPADHGRTQEIATSRTSGQPVRVRSTSVTDAFWHAITLRDHAWHGRDLTAKLASIRYTGDDAAAPAGVQARGWGPATQPFAPDAPLAVLSIRSTIDEMIAWLRREDPAYLLIYPTVLDAILRRLADTSVRLPSLRQVRTTSERLAPETRALCAEVLGVPLVDLYSAQEVGYLALQCPSHPHYHVQAERVLVEILDDAGAPCGPGATGRVVVTDLHNFATPLIRYDIGDYAEVGAPCPCGRGLPVLDRIVGRRRGMLSYPDGRVAWPVFTVPCRQAARYRELQLVQDTVDALRLRIVPDGPLTADDRAALTAALHACLGHPFAITFEVVAELGRTPAGKLEEFVSHVPRP
ncbi:MAG: phenylacetate--CoA ligase family protein [Kofleriaceae bacterium]|nr:phenylacetate--CoA ligase family protein [Myxococcales bacterium]MCB9560067.1 phenylacetate--CoA ligase family protein [Kofleriaceae bacterium]MCB9571880.1 phenylacetate--CoA ligase family protein [Kofleriaceae bacterium]